MESRNKWPNLATNIHQISLLVSLVREYMYDFWDEKKKKSTHKRPLISGIFILSSSKELSTKKKKNNGTCEMPPGSPDV
jgi:hypothetical protein